MIFGELMPLGGGDPIPLLKSKLLIGRRDSCDIVLRFPNVSSQHCLLEMVNGYWSVRDMGSSNGTKVNGSRVDSRWLLPGDELAVAKHRYHITYTPQTEAEAPQVPAENVEMSLMEKAGLVRRKPASPVAPPGESLNPNEQRASRNKFRDNKFRDEELEDLPWDEDES